MRLGDYNLPSTELTTHIAMALHSDDLAGETSSTADVNKGVKPKIITCSCLIKFSDKQQLTDLTEVVEATDNNGDLIIHPIIDELANAMNINQVKFTENFTVREIEGIHAWRVGFKLKEFNSTAEKNEQIQQQKKIETAQKAQGNTVAVDPSMKAVKTEQLTSFEGLLKSVDDFLKPDEDKEQSEAAQ